MKRAALSVGLAFSVVLIGSPVSASEPVTCQSHDPDDMSIAFARVTSVERSREEWRSGWWPLNWSIHYTVRAKLRPELTLRGEMVLRDVDLETGCLAVGWLDWRSRRFCSRQFQVGEQVVVSIYRPTGEASINPALDIVTHYDQRLQRTQLPPC